MESHFPSGLPECQDTAALSCQVIPFSDEASVVRDVRKLQQCIEWSLNMYIIERPTLIIYAQVQKRTGLYIIHNHEKQSIQTPTLHIRGKKEGTTQPASV